MESVPTSSWRIGDWEFRPETGELRRRDGRDTEHPGPVRLQPQPARLLELLARRAGELVTKDEIRDVLWPDTYVDLDQSLSFCVRQIRAALGDSASEPRYVETLARRGYRLLAQTESPDRAGAGKERPAGPTPRRGKARWAMAAGAVAAMALALWFRAADPDPAPTPTRLAIMPFELAADGAEEGPDLAKISESLVVELSGHKGLEVVGPRSTAIYSDFPFPDLRRLAADLEVDYVLNARFLSEPDPQLIVELIRLSDGAHPWVERFAGPGRWREVASRIRAGVDAALKGSSAGGGRGASTAPRRPTMWAR